MTERDLAAALRRFAVRVSDESPLYSAICFGVADDPLIAKILAGARANQPPANMLLAGVQYLLLEGHGAELAAHYPALRPPGVRPAGDPVELFRGFCGLHLERLSALVADHTVQTNEVRRCAGLLPAFTLVARHSARPLALIEIGSSAGLNLRFDAYRYDYGNGLVAGPPDAAVHIATDSRGHSPPVVSQPPAVGWRVGVDLDPIDVTDPGAVRWARALLWPEQPERVARFERAIADAAAAPPRVIQGDGVAMVGEQAAEAPRDAHLCIFHTFTFNQIPDDDAARFDDALRSLSLERAVDRVAIEFAPEGRSPCIELGRYRNGTAAWETLGAMHHHGAWLSWGRRLSFTGS